MTSKVTLRSTSERVTPLVTVDDEEEVTFLGENPSAQLTSLPGGAVLRRRALKRRHKGAVSPHKATEVGVRQGEAKEEKTGNLKENFDLKEILLNQLEVIRKQSEEIVEKDKQLREIQKENEKLKAKLRAFCSKENFQHEKQNTVVSTDRVRRNLVQEEKQKQEIRKFLKTKEIYFVRQGEEQLAQERREVKHILSDVELPGWRINVLSANYAMEGTENIEDEVLLRRHAKQENDEKRRKR